MSFGPWGQFTPFGYDFLGSILMFGFYSCCMVEHGVLPCQDSGESMIKTSVPGRRKLHRRDD